MCDCTARKCGGFAECACSCHNDLRASLARGLAQSAAGDVIDVGDFTRFIDNDSGSDNA